MSEVFTHQTCPLNEVELLCSETDQAFPSPEIQELAVLEVSPDTFHAEEGGDRFASLAACRPEHLHLFETYQTRLSDRVAALSTEQIVATLRRLYESAYAYDPKRRTMDVGNRQAKRELDLWIAAIDHRAFRDESFLRRVKVPSVERILTLNSPHLDPLDRGSYHRLEKGLSTFEEETEEGYRWNFDWLRGYDGSVPPYETPFWKSSNEVFRLDAFTFGEEEVIRMGRQDYPHETVSRLLEESGLRSDYERLEVMPTERLMGRLLGVMALVRPDASPALNRRLAKEVSLASLILTSRGENVAEFQRQYRDLLIQSGWNRHDADLFSNQGDVRVTGSRLDDYESRFLYLKKFRERYRDFLSTPLSDRFSPENSRRYGLWGQQLLNRSLTGAPIRLEDIDRIRREVAEEIGGRTNGPMTWDEIREQGRARPLWFRADELGINADLETDPLGMADRITVEGHNLRQFILDNVDYVTILPPRLMPDHDALGIAFLLFGVVIMNSVTDDGRRIPFTPGSFLAVLAHEAGHHYYARANFDEHPERLTWGAVTERWSYIFNTLVEEAYLQNGPEDPEDARRLVEFRRGTPTMIQAANRRLGLEPSNYDLIFDAQHWGRQRPDFFAFHPGSIVDGDGRIEPTFQEVLSRHTPGETGPVWNEWVEDQLKTHFPDEGERGQVMAVLATLDQLQDDGISETYDPGHPFLRLIGRIYRDMSQSENPFTTTGADWRELKEALTAGLLRNREQWQERDELLRSNASFLPSFLSHELQRLGLDRRGKGTLFRTIDRLEGDDYSRPVWLTPNDPLFRIIATNVPEVIRWPRYLIVLSRDEWLDIKAALLHAALAKGICRKDS